MSLVADLVLAAVPVLLKFVVAPCVVMVLLVQAHVSSIEMAILLPALTLLALCVPRCGIHVERLGGCQVLASFGSCATWLTFTLPLPSCTRRTAASTCCSWAPGPWWWCLILTP